jgi:hypothetical protein
MCTHIHIQAPLISFDDDLSSSKNSESEQQHKVSQSVLIHELPSMEDLDATAVAGNGYGSGGKATSARERLVNMSHRVRGAHQDHTNGLNRLLSEFAQACDGLQKKKKEAVMSRQVCLCVRACVCLDVGMLCKRKKGKLSCGDMYVLSMYACLCVCLCEVSSSTARRAIVRTELDEKEIEVRMRMLECI